MKYIKEELDMLVLSLASLLGKFPTKADINSCELLPSYNTCQRSGVRLQELYPKWTENQYSLSPKVCPACSGTVPFDKRVNTFCGSSCSATYNNKQKVVKNVKAVEARAMAMLLGTERGCLQCDAPLESRGQRYSTYCSKDCHTSFKHERDIGLWLAGGIPDAGNKRLKGFLTALVGYECSVCRISEWEGKPISLEVEHKSGDSEDNSKENVCLICPNCHSQTSTYKGRNRGHGRHSRRQRYAEGKSY